MHDEISGKLARLRAANGLTQQQVANAAGIHISVYARFEYGTRDLSRASAQTVLGIAQALHTTVEDLLKK